MADDIVLTVRVRDLTRGEFAHLRREMQGMDSSVRHLGNTSSLTSQRAQQMGRSIQGVSGRLGQLQRSGNLAESEMSHMRRTMGLLNRDLRLAARAGELTDEEFGALRNQLERTRLSFDHLDSDIRRHNAVAQRQARDAAAAQRAQLQQQQQQARLIMAERRRVDQAHAAALRENARREAAALRDAEAIGRAHAAALRENARREAEALRNEQRLQMAQARQLTDHNRRISRAYSAALREDEARNRRAQAAAAHAAAQMAAVMRRQEADQRAHLARLASMNDADRGLNFRFQGLDDSDLRRIIRSMSSLSNSVNGLSGNSARARRNIGSLGRDLNVMSQALRNAARDGNLSRQDFNALSNGLLMASRSARDLRHSGDLTRSTYRDIRREVDLLRARLRGLDSDGNIFTRLASRLTVLSGRFRQVDANSGLLRRTFARIGDWGARGASRASGVLGALAGVMGRVTSKLASLSRGMWLFIAVVALIGPAAQALGAVLVTALGGAFVALGAFALRSSSQVKGAFTQLKSTLGSVLRNAAAPLEGSLADGIRQVGIAAKKMEPQLKKAFTATAPLVSNLFGGVTDLAATALPGLTFALKNSQKAMAGFRTFLGDVGTGIGNMFKIITQGNDQNLAKAWQVLGDEVKNALESVGEFISSMLNSGSATLLVIGIFRTFTGALNVISGVFQALDTLLVGLPGHLANLIDNAGKLGKTFGDSAELSTLSISDMKDRLKEVNEQIKSQQNLLKGNKLPGRVQSHVKDNLNGLLAERKDLLLAIAGAEGDNATAVQKEATAYRDLLKAIEDLADKNRGYLDSLSGEQQAIDDADKFLKDAAKNHKSYADALKLVNGQVDLTSQRGRDAYDVLSKIATATKDATDKAIAADVPWKTIQQNWQSGYDKIVHLADGMGLSASQAKELANRIVGLPPSKDIVIKAQTQDAITSLDGVIAAMQASPSTKTITVKTLSAQAEQLLVNLGYTVERLPDGSITITAKTGSASENIAGVKAARDGLTGKSITMSAKDASTATIKNIIAWISQVTGKKVTITTVHRTVFETIGSAPSTTADALRQQADRFGKGAIGGSAAQIARRGFASGGSIAGNVLQGPGTSTSDSIVARLSRGEFVMKASAVQKYGLGFMMALNSGIMNRLPGFASGGVTSSEKKARSDARPDLTLSHFGIMAGYTTDEFAHGLAQVAQVGDLVSNLNRARSVIQHSTHGSTESRLLKELDNYGKSLLTLKQRQNAVSKALESAKDKLNDLKQAAAQLKDSVKSAVLGDTNITKSATAEDSQVTINTILSQMRGNAAQSQEFSTGLDTLRKRGLSGDLISQIAQAGLENGGLETVRALLGASGSQLEELTGLQSQITSFAGKAGDAASNAMYGAGIQAAQGLVNGLEAQAKLINKSMWAIAKNMEKEIKKALGIKSPSRVMMKVGHFAAEGFALGVEKNIRARTAWESMLGGRSGASGTSAVAGAGSSSQPFVVQIAVGDKNLGEILIDPLRKSIRHRGGDVQAVLGK